MSRIRGVERQRVRPVGSAFVAAVQVEVAVFQKRIAEMREARGGSRCRRGRRPNFSPRDSMPSTDGLRLLGEPQSHVRRVADQRRRPAGPQNCGPVRGRVAEPPARRRAAARPMAIKAEDQAVSRVPEFSVDVRRQAARLLVRVGCIILTERVGEYASQVSEY